MPHLFELEMFSPACYCTRFWVVFQYFLQVGWEIENAIWSSWSWETDAKRWHPFIKAYIFTIAGIWRKHLIWRSSLLVKMISSICHSVSLIGKSLLIEILSLWKCSKFLNTTSRMWYSWLGYFAQTTRNNWMHLIEHGASSRRYMWSKNSRILIVWEGFKDHLVQSFSKVTTHPNHLEVQKGIAGALPLVS